MIKCSEFEWQNKYQNVLDSYIIQKACVTWYSVKSSY